MTNANNICKSISFIFIILASVSTGKVVQKAEEVQLMQNKIITQTKSNFEQRSLIIN